MTRNPVTVPGDRVELVQSTDTWTRLRAGAQGVVTLIDDLGTIHVTWDDGHQLGLVPNIDHWRILPR